jgi:hypothetical protein
MQGTPMGLDLELNAPTILIPFDTSACEAVAAVRSARTDATAVLQMGVVRVASRVPGAGAASEGGVGGEAPGEGGERYMVSFSGMRFVMLPAAGGGWPEPASWRGEPAVLSPFSLTLTLHIAADSGGTDAPLVSIEGAVSTVELHLSELDCQHLRRLLSILAALPAAAHPPAGDAAPARDEDPPTGRLIKSASLPLDFSDSFLTQVRVVGHWSWLVLIDRK